IRCGVGQERQQSREPLARDDTAVEIARCLSVALRSDSDKSAPTRSEIRASCSAVEAPIMGMTWCATVSPTWTAKSDHRYFWIGQVVVGSRVPGGASGPFANPTQLATDSVTKPSASGSP